MAKSLLLIVALCPAPLVAQTVRLVGPGGVDTGECVATACATVTYAISRAASGDIVSLAAGVYTENRIPVDRSVIVRGVGRDLTVVQGAAEPRTAAGRVFSVHAGVNAVLEDLTIRHGNDITAGEGGGLHNLGSATLRRVAVLSNFAPSAAGDGPRGGGLYNRGFMRLEEVLVRSNTAARGGLYGSSVGGGIYHHGVSGNEVLEIMDSVIEANDADVSGGIEVIDDECYCPGPTVRIERSTVAGNSAQRAGGVRNFLGEVAILNSTISGNSATALWGGGIESEGGSLRLSHSTITGNTAATYGGGLESVGFELRNTIIAGNTAPAGPDCYTHTSAGLSHDYNLIGEPDHCALTGALEHSVLGAIPMLAPLANNGGPTLTHALEEEAPAIDAGTCDDAEGQLVAIDQRGLTRNAPCDMGAFEYGAGIPTGADERPADQVLALASANPFMDEVALTLTVAAAGHAKVTVHDAVGRLVAVLFEGDLAGNSPRRLELDGRPLAPGVYAVTAEVNRGRGRLLITRAR